MQPAIPCIRQSLESGDVIAYPTEAVWGLGCDPWNEGAVRRLLAIKQRPVDKGLILVAGEWAHLAPLLSDLNGQQIGQLKAGWPGPLTWLVPAHPLVPDWVTGAHDTVAVRWSDHPVVRRVTGAFGGPIVSTSANRAGHPAARRQFQVRAWLGDRVDRIIPGQTGGLIRPSTIRRLGDGATLRE